MSGLSTPRQHPPGAAAPGGGRGRWGMSEQERRWVTVPEFAAYLGVSPDHAYRLVVHDPDVKRVSRRFGRRVLVCLYAFQRGLEAEMSEKTR